MMVRQGFVSNSSSSSFLLHVRDSNRCPHCGRKDPDIIDLISRAENYSSDTEIIANGREEVLAYLNEDEYEGRKSLVDKVNEVPEGNGTIVYVSVSYHDTTMQEMIENSPDITVLSKEGE